MPFLAAGKNPTAENVHTGRMGLSSKELYIGRAKPNPNPQRSITLSAIPTGRVRFMKKNGRKAKFDAPLLPKCPTGIQGLDKIIGGGLPKGRPTPVCGSAGCRKTLVATEFLVRGATQFGVPGALRTEEQLRALAHRVIQVQEDERGRVALELHDGVTQCLCGLIFRSQALLASLSAGNRVARGEARKLRDIACRTVREVERVSHNLRPSILDLGLVPALRDASSEFAERTGVSIKLGCKQLTVRLAAASELTLYRILQEALRNVEKHARARRVIVILSQPDAFVQLVIKDDGVGFDSEECHIRLKGDGGFGLLGMRERATYVGGSLELKSIRSTGTEITIRIPLTPAPSTAARR
jgi:signal transduction histidine kinase